MNKHFGYHRSLNFDFVPKFMFDKKWKEMGIQIEWSKHIFKKK